MKLSMTEQEKGDFLIQASVWAGLTVLYLSSDESIHVSVKFTWNANNKIEMKIKL
jgi:hypothetical protein